MNKTRRLLTIVAHPDDEIIGCGGSVARLVAEGYEAYALILGEGITSRDDQRQRTKRKRELAGLKKQVVQANEILGVNKTFIFDLPDNRFDSVPMLDIVKIVEKVKEDIRPGIIFTHYERDLNIDHRITCQAVITATRPLADESVKELYSFEVLSSTEWNYPLSFRPDVFFCIDDTLEVKINAMKRYESELREFPHPRSVRGITLQAEYWGMRTGTRYAEAMRSLRVIK